jgi:hypothetical protein
MNKINDNIELVEKTQHAVEGLHTIVQKAASLRTRSEGTYAQEIMLDLVNPLQEASDYFKRILARYEIRKSALDYGGLAPLHLIGSFCAATSLLPDDLKQLPTEKIQKINYEADKLLGKNLEESVSCYARILSQNNRKELLIKNAKTVEPIKELMDLLHLIGDLRYERGGN